MKNFSRGTPKDPEPSSGDHHATVIDVVKLFSTDCSDAGEFPPIPQTDSDRSDEEYWAAFRAAPFACLVFDLETLQIVSATKIVGERFGFVGREMESHDLSVLWPESEFPDRLEFIKRTSHLTSGDSHGPVPMRTHDGRRFFTRFVFRNVRLDGRNLRVVFFPDIQEECSRG